MKRRILAPFPVNVKQIILCKRIRTFSTKERFKGQENENKANHASLLKYVKGRTFSVPNNLSHSYKKESEYKSYFNQ